MFVHLVAPLGALNIVLFPSCHIRLELCLLLSCHLSLREASTLEHEEDTGLFGVIAQGSASSDTSPISCSPAISTSLLACPLLEPVRPKALALELLSKQTIVGR